MHQFVSAQLVALLIKHVAVLTAAAEFDGFLHTPGDEPPCRQIVVFLGRYMVEAAWVIRTAWGNCQFHQTATKCVLERVMYSPSIGNYQFADRAAVRRLVRKCVNVGLCVVCCVFVVCVCCMCA